MIVKKLSPDWVERLTRARLWPIQHTPDFYRRAAIEAPPELVRALLLLLADRLPR